MLSLIGFTDSDYEGTPNDMRSTRAYNLYLGDNLVSWTSSKQRVLARSSAEVVYRVLTLAYAYITWLTSLLTKLKIP